MNNMLTTNYNNNTFDATISQKHVRDANNSACIATIIINPFPAATAAAQSYTATITNLLQQLIPSDRNCRRTPDAGPA